MTRPCHKTPNASGLLLVKARCLESTWTTHALLQGIDSPLQDHMDSYLGRLGTFNQTTLAYQREKRLQALYSSDYTFEQKSASAVQF